jgi:hypothetical protein
MAHYAFIDENNIITEVIVGKNEGEDGKSGEDWEAHYGAFRGQVCKKTSYNGNIRKNYAGIGFKYDTDLDAFVPPKPFASWLLNNETAQWNPPVAMPNDEGMYSWDEETISWKKVLNGPKNP